MNSKYLKTLEFHKILRRLAEHSSFSAGWELAMNLAPSSDMEEVRRRQKETTEARYLLKTRPGLSLSGASDIREKVERAEKGAVLLPTELLDIRNTLSCGRALRNSILRLKACLPNLSLTASAIEDCPHIISEIGRCINEKGEVVDSASKELARIRREIKITRERLLNRLEKIVTSPENTSFLQETFITQRSGRYVIPLKADFKGRIPGIVHDLSASGATIFIEPIATLELGNLLRELELEEKKEVNRLLSSLSSLVAEEGQKIKRTVEALAELDLTLAKAKYAEEIEGVEPELVPFRRKCEEHPGSTIRLKKARHPLLDPEKVVPIDVHLSDDYFILVITGPNTGGKTVSLKTVGLLSLMAQAGMHIPADEGSALSVFSGIYADIGEEQSIEQSLSTFSSHMTNIINILRMADERSLVILDDLGAGTDPSEGSSLAQALLLHLLRRRITTFVATHYPELKVFAHATTGIENACVEFDVETLSPTYKLSIGLPGRSNALEIAERLGLRPEIVEEARNLMSPRELETEELLLDIRRAHEEAIKEREEAKRARQEAEELKRELEERLRELKVSRREILQVAREEARRELRAVKEELRGIRARLRAASFEEELIKQSEEKLEEIERRTAPPEPIPFLSLREPISVGDTVSIKRLGITGEVISLSEDGAEVQAGRFRLKARLEDLEKTTSTIRGDFLPSASFHTSPGLEIDLRGQTVEEALPRLDKYLDDSYLAELPFVRVIHGKGEGILRRAVREMLNGHPLVESHRPGEEHEGGDGVTVVKLTS